MNGVELPTDVQNAIEDVFMETDNIENVVCYYKNELESFRKDLTFTNKVDIYTDGSSNGTVFLSFTYYGQVEFSLSEHTTLLSKENGFASVVEKITDIDNSENLSNLYDSEEYNVILVEKLSWESPNKPKREDHLFIYCPDLEGEEGDDSGN